MNRLLRVNIAFRYCIPGTRVHDGHAQFISVKCAGVKVRAHAWCRPAIETLLLINGEFLSFCGNLRCELRVCPGVSSLCVQQICYPVPGVSRALSVALSLSSDRYVALASTLTSRLVNRGGVAAAGIIPESC